MWIDAFKGLRSNPNQQPTMKGTRPLDNNEIRLVFACFDGIYEHRNRGHFMLGVSTGGKISKLLSLQIGDVYQNGKPVTDLLFDKKIVKGGEVSRAVPVNVDGRTAIENLIDWHRKKYKTIAPSRPLFPSRNKKGTVPMNRQTAHEMLKKAFLERDSMANSRHTGCGKVSPSGFMRRVVTSTWCKSRSVTETSPRRRSIAV